MRIAELRGRPKRALSGDERLFHLTVLKDIIAASSFFGISDPFAASDEIRILDHIDWIFKRPLFRRDDRYSKTFHALYTGLTPRVSIQEIKYYVRKSADEQIVNDRFQDHTKVFDLLTVRAQGSFHNLLGWPRYHAQLVHRSDRSLCQHIGKLLHKDGSHGVIAPSARFHTGKNCVVFQRSIIRPGELAAAVTFDFKKLGNRKKVILKHSISWKANPAAT